MKFTTQLKEVLSKISGYTFYKNADIPVGSDLIHDLKNKIQLPLNTIFDVGANVGQTAITFNNYFSDAVIYSFEPFSMAYGELVKNTKNKVKCFDLALGDKIESLEVNIFDDNRSNLNSLKKDVQNIEGSRKEIIKVTTGDAFCLEHNISDIDLLKIDTEGFEIQVLQGFMKMISESKIKALYCEVGFSTVNERNTYLNDLIDFASQNNFQFYGLYEINNERIVLGKNFGNALFINNSVVSQ
jgi:FkbM family methyltransferase